MMSGRVLHANLHLLDRQIVHARTGRLMGKVDDLELDFTGDVPVVTALLSGPGVWGSRLPGAIGRIVVALSEKEPVRIPFKQVVDVDSAVRIVWGDDETQ